MAEISPERPAMKLRQIDRRPYRPIWELVCDGCGDVVVAPEGKNITEYARAAGWERRDKRLLWWDRALSDGRRVQGGCAWVEYRCPECCGKKETEKPMKVAINDLPVTATVLRRWRAAMKWTQAKAADELGIGRRTYRYWESETDARSPEHPRLIRIALNALATEAA